MAKLSHRLEVGFGLFRMMFILPKLLQLFSCEEMSWNTSHFCVLLRRQNYTDTFLVTTYFLPGTWLKKILVTSWQWPTCIQMMLISDPVLYIVAHEVSHLVYNCINTNDFKHSWVKVMMKYYSMKDNHNLL